MTITFLAAAPADTFPAAILPVPAIMLTAAAIMALIERRRPAWQRPESPAWWGRSAVFNSLQAAVAALGVVTWDRWFAGFGGYGSLAIESSWIAVLAGYLLVTLVFYWWHRARHASPVLWKMLHRFHHSPTRLEVLTSFYKHPVELIANGALTSAITYFVLGLSPVETSFVVMLTGLAELFYHWNVRTPRWLGLFFQRPEMHRLHHARGLHHYNYSGLPMWDALFGTYRNPQEDVPLCGFPEERRLTRLLCGLQVKEV